MNRSSDEIDAIWSVIRRPFGRAPAALPLAIWQEETRDWLLSSAETARKKESRSLSTEHSGAMNAVTPQLRRALGRRLDTFDRAVAQALQPKADAKTASTARRSINRLGTALNAPAARQAAWDDAIAIAIDPDGSLHSARSAVVQLEALLQRAGFDPKVRIRKLAAILEGSALDIAEASVALGRRRPGRWPHHHARSRMNARERVHLCRDLVALTAEPTTCTVWLAYRRARLPETVLESGGVTFMNLNAARESIRATGSLLGTPFHDENSLPPSDPEDDLALVQVILEEHLQRDAVADAVAIVDAVTGDIAADAIGNTWQQLGWYRVRFASGGGGSGHFTPRSEEADIRRTYDHERSAERLAERSDRLTKAVRRRPPYDRLVADALRSRGDAKGASSVRNAIVLLGRSMEAAASASSLDVQVIRDLAVSEWPWAAIRVDIRHSTYLAVGRDDLRFRRDEVLHRLADQIITDVRHTWSDVVSTEAVVLLAAELEAATENRVERRNVAALVRTLVEPAAYLDRIDQLRADAVIYQARSRRVRNALMHGNPVSDVSTASVKSPLVANESPHLGACL